MRTRLARAAAGAPQGLADASSSPPDSPASLTGTECASPAAPTGAPSRRRRSAITRSSAGNSGAPCTLPVVPVPCDAVSLSRPAGARPAGAVAPRRRGPAASACVPLCCSACSMSMRVSSASKRASCSSAPSRSVTRIGAPRSVGPAARPPPRVGVPAGRSGAGIVGEGDGGAAASWLRSFATSKPLSVIRFGSDCTQHGQPRSGIALATRLTCSNSACRGGCEHTGLAPEPSGPCRYTCCSCAWCARRVTRGAPTQAGAGHSDAPNVTEALPPSALHPQSHCPADPATAAGQCSAWGSAARTPTRACGGQTKHT